MLHRIKSAAEQDIGFLELRPDSLLELPPTSQVVDFLAFMIPSLW